MGIWAVWGLATWPGTYIRNGPTRLTETDPTFCYSNRPVVPLGEPRIAIHYSAYSGIARVGT